MVTCHLRFQLYSWLVSHGTICIAAQAVVSDVKSRARVTTHIQLALST
jgi:hypothetical protein